MADYYSVTSCDPIELNQDQIQKVEKLCEEYYIPNLEYGPIEDEKNLGFWLYDTFQVFDNDEDYNDVTDEFLKKLSHILKEDQEFKMCSIGHEKLRYEAASQVVVKKDSVEWNSIGAG